MAKSKSALLALLLLGAPAAAADDKAAPGTSVEMPFLIAPMSIDDQLVAYAYISSKVVASSPAAEIEVRDKLPFIQDAYVRDVNAAPVTKASDPKTVDTVALVARLLADAKRIAGADKVTNVVITEIRFAPLKSDGQTQAPGPS